MTVHIKDGSRELDEDDLFIIAGNGIFMRKKNHWVDAMVKVPSIDGLEKQQVQAKLLLPPIPSSVFSKAVLFFFAVYKKQRTESAVLLHFSKTAGWELSIPDQEATGSYVEYDTTQRLDGYTCVGTMHSHCAMSAFHSGTDIHDEAAQDGVHITIGRLDYFPLFSVDAEIVVNGNRFKMPIEHVEGLESHGLVKKTLTQALFAFSHNRDPMYSIQSEELAGWGVPEAWTEAVKKKTYASYGGQHSHSPVERNYGKYRAGGGMDPIVGETGYLHHVSERGEE